MEINIFNGIAFFVWIVSLFALLVLVIRLGLSSKKQESIIKQLESDRGALLEQIGRLSAEKDANALKDDDGFVRFLSQSRDWAYEYIENAQKQISDFYDKVSPAIDDLNKIDNDNIKLVLEAYKELAKLLPKDPDKLD